MAQEAVPGMPTEVPATAIRAKSTSALSHSPSLLAISAVFAAAALAALFNVWSSWLPVAGLDPSWAYAVNEAVFRHLIFGRDFIWTYGPFGAVSTGLYHPATDALMLTGSILMAIAVYGGFGILVWPGRSYLLLLLPIVLLLPTIVFWLLLSIAVGPVHHVLRLIGLPLPLSSLPFLLLLVVFRLSVPPESRLYLRLIGSAFLGVAVLSCAVGILPLIKGSFLPLAVVEGSVAVLMAFVARRRALAFGILLFGIASLCIGWVAAGQPLAALPRFFWAQEQIISGYSQAMSLDGPLLQLLYWGIPAAVITAIFYACITRREGLPGWLAFLGFVFYLFVAFKEEFVRQDLHVLGSGETFLLAALFLAALLDPWPAIVVAVVACLGWVAIEGSAINSTGATGLANIEKTAHRAAGGVIKRVVSPHALPDAFARANAAIHAASPLPSVKGTVDLYPYDLALLFAAGMKWDGRPVIQSYSAYTPALMEANAKHLIGNDAPTNIFFAVDPIDGRLPALEDALSWPLLLSRYSIVGLHANYLQMVRAAHPAPMRFEGREVRVAARLNNWIDVPADGGLLWARIDMRPTVLGKLVLAAYKLPNVSIELRLADGRTARFRYIPEMGRAGFLLSPSIGSTADFAMMAAGQDMDAKVLQLRLVAPEVGLWSQRVFLSFTKLDVPSQRGVRGLVLTEPSSSPPGFLTAGNSNRAEDCSIDMIGGRLLSSQKEPIVVSGDRVNVIGWTAPAASRGIGPDETWIGLSSASGELFYRARMVPRPDVLAYYKQPKMRDPGFSADLDLLGLSGIQKLTIYSTHGNEAFRCSALAVLQLPPSNSHAVQSGTGVSLPAGGGKGPGK